MFDEKRGMDICYENGPNFLTSSIQCQSIVTMYTGYGTMYQLKYEMNFDKNTCPWELGDQK